METDFFWRGGRRNLRSLLRLSLDYVRSVLKAESVEGGIKIDPATQLLVGISGKITLREPGANARGSGLLSADDLLSQLDQALGNVGQKVWLVLDRLDVAFAETTTLEANALRAVFRVYLDMLGLSNVALKIFLRTDIWRRITIGGFREASHITRHITLSWDAASLLNLVIRRALHNEPVRSFSTWSRVMFSLTVTSRPRRSTGFFPIKLTLQTSQEAEEVRLHRGESTPTLP